MRFHNAGMAVMRFLDEITCCLIFFLMVWYKDGREVDVEECMRLSAHDIFLEVALFCVCKLAGETNVNFVVVVGTSALGDRQKGLCGSSLDSCHQHALHQVRHLNMLL
jgi:hypothetical protein